MPSRTSPAAFWLRIFLLGFAVVCALLLITLFTPPSVGDLARLGRVSETEFGWHRPPPQVPRPILQGSPAEEADILVIGDSFSMTHRWQSALVRSGYKVTTTFWGQYNEAMCADFDQWLAKAGFHGQLVIMQSVERLLAQRLQKSSECATTAPPLKAQTAPFWESPEEVPAFRLNTGAPLMTGWITFRNTRRIKKAPGDMPADYGTIGRVVPDGCKYFSNRLCSRALFFSEDVDNGALSAADVQRMATFNSRHSGVPILWMVIPNKTTIYIDPTHSADFVRALTETHLGPDLFAFARDQRGRIMDFYFPNDTHLSMHGQLALGQYMLGEVQRRVPTPRSKSP